MQSLMAILLANLPVRYWAAMEQRFPVHRAAWLSGLAVMLGGLALGAFEYIAFLREAADGMHQTLMGAQSDFVQTPAWALLSLVAFLFMTPQGVLSLYLAASGFLRAAAAFVADDPRGDFVLTAVDSGVRRLAGGRRASRARAKREALEGPAVPDRLVRGEQIARPDLALVLLASRARPGWAPGAYLVGADGAAHRLDAAFDVEMPAGLRTAYPLTPLTTLEPIRHAIPYELPRGRGTA